MLQAIVARQHYRIDFRLSIAVKESNHDKTLAKTNVFSQQVSRSLNSFTVISKTRFHNKKICDSFFSKDAR
jgi:hypothetical protein